MSYEHYIFLIDLFLLVIGSSGIIISLFLYLRNKNRIIRIYCEALISWTMVQIVLLGFYYLNEIMNIRHGLTNAILNDLTFVFLAPFCYKLMILIHDIFKVEMAKSGRIMLLIAMIFLILPSTVLSYFYNSIENLMVGYDIFKGVIFYGFIYFVAFDINSHISSIINDDIRYIFKIIFIIQMIFYPLMIAESILFFEGIQPFGISILVLFYAIINLTWLYFVSKYLYLPEIKLISENDDFDNYYVIYKISKREKEVVRLLLNGLSYEQIAKQLFITLETVKSHVNNIYKKSGVGSKIELSNLVQKCKNG